MLEGGRSREAAAFAEAPVGSQLRCLRNSQGAEGRRRAGAAHSVLGGGVKPQACRSGSAGLDAIHHVATGGLLAGESCDRIYALK